MGRRSIYQSSAHSQLFSFILAFFNVEKSSPYRLDMASAIHFGDDNSGFQAGIINGPVNIEFHHHAAPGKSQGIDVRQGFGRIEADAKGDAGFANYSNGTRRNGTRRRHK
jgi:hypothetical protein